MMVIKAMIQWIYTYVEFVNFNPVLYVETENVLIQKQKSALF
jgi:hypothetical protein